MTISMWVKSTNETNIANVNQNSVRLAPYENLTNERRCGRQNFCVTHRSGLTIS